MTDKLLISSTKQPLGVSPNTILYGDDTPTELTLLAEIDNTPSSTTSRTIRDYVDAMMARQGRIIRVAISSQQSNLQRRYAHYPRAPILQRRRIIIVPRNFWSISWCQQPHHELLPPKG